jgi:uncharacterized NAD(P)/FAD-binding protein YdhS
VIGAGFTGTLLAAQLAERLGGAAEITLFDRSGTFGRGIAYVTANPCHLLNVAAGNMSAFDGAPGHFVDWLTTAGHLDAPSNFVGRGVYGGYLESVLDRCPNVVRVAAEVRRVAVDDAGVVIHRSPGRPVRVDSVVLCIGNLPPLSPAERRMASACQERHIANPWNWSALAGIGESEGVVLVGTSLTMVDVALELQARGHRGPLLAVSRHGLLPQSHRANRLLGDPVSWMDVTPSALALLRTLRRAAREEMERGGDWRSVVDSLRPHTQALWRGLPEEERNRFLRHLKAQWEVHRHRLAPAVAEAVERLKQDGRLAVAAGHVRQVLPGPQGLRVVLRERGRRTLRTVEAGWIVNCSGPAADYSRVADPLIRSLFKAGLARPGPSSIGLDVDGEYRLLDAAGTPSPRLSCIGPPIRGVLWETTAVPDIRRQCKVLAERLAAA